MIDIAVIPAAGLGTRMLPVSKAIPKEMLPIVDKPIIQWVVEECVSAGIKRIVLITDGAKTTLENHFDHNIVLESTLEKKGKHVLLSKIKTLSEGVALITVRQGKPLGLGHAILQARPVVGDNDFVVVLPDVLIGGVRGDNDLELMIKRFHKRGRSQVMVEPVSETEVDKYGIVAPEQGPLLPGESGAISGIIEKPCIDKAPSNLAVVGRYVLSKNIWPLLERTAPGAGGEIQLTDAIFGLIGTQGVDAYHIRGRSSDCGNMRGYLLTFIERALSNVEYGSELRERLVALIKEE